MRDATKSDLYALQHASEDLDDHVIPSWPYFGGFVQAARPAPRPEDIPRLFHKNCGGRIHFRSMSKPELDRYYCDGQHKVFGKCGWDYRCSKVHAWTDEEIGKWLAFDAPIDEKVYKLALHVGTGREGYTFYETRPATREERASAPEFDTWKVR